MQQEYCSLHQHGIYLKQTTDITKHLL